MEDTDRRPQCQQVHSVPFAGNRNIASGDTAARHIAAVWSRRLTNARQHYEKAREACKEACASQANIPHPDGPLAYRQALRAETAAVAKYTKLLMIFSALTPKGKIPPEE